MNPFFYPGDIEEIVNALGPNGLKFEGKTVLITGGKGFLGRYLAETFRHLNRSMNKPVKVIILDNLITAGLLGTEFKGDENITCINHDVIQPIALDQKIDYVLHLAGIASPFYYRAHPLETLDVAVTGLRNMLEVAKASQARVTFFSSSEIYGDPDPIHVPTQETYRGNVACIGPRACYDESKRLGETLCHIYFTEHRLHTNIIRPFNVYGPGMQERDFRVLPNFAHRIKQNAPLKIYGTGDQTRTFCYITDAVVGFLLVACKGVAGEPYNIGNPNPEISMLTLAKKMETAIGRPLKIQTMDYPHTYPGDEPMRRCPDITKAQHQLGYLPNVSLDEGLRRFLTWTDQTYSGNQ